MLRVEAEGPVLRLTLARPEVRNALNEELISAIADAFQNLSSAIRVVILAGEGAAFCAGGDLNWMRRAAEYTFEENERDAFRIAKMFESIALSHALVIAQVHGSAFGGACGLVAAADLAVATETATFCFSEARLGLVPATISPFVLSKIGSSHARALFTTAEPFSAARALQAGLIHEVCSDSEIESVVERKVAAVLACGPQAVSQAKRLASEPPKTLDAAAKLLAEVRAGDEAKEGISAFLEKRKASYVVKR